VVERAAQPRWTLTPLPRCTTFSLPLGVMRVSLINKTDNLKEYVCGARRTESRVCWWVPALIHWISTCQGQVLSWGLEMDQQTEMAQVSHWLQSFCFHWSWQTMRTNKVEKLGCSNLKDDTCVKAKRSAGLPENILKNVIQDSSVRGYILAKTWRSGGSHVFPVPIRTERKTAWRVLKAVRRALWLVWPHEKASELIGLGSVVLKGLILKLWFWAGHSRPGCNDLWKQRSGGSQFKDSGGKKLVRPYLNK
jgi:hypothetical protein